MKLFLITLLALVVISASQPVDESLPAAAVSNPDDAVNKFITSDDEEVHDMEGSELILKLIEKKLAKLTKKCYKLGGCGYAPSYGYHAPSYGYHADYGYAPHYPGYGTAYY